MRKNEERWVLEEAAIEEPSGLESLADVQNQIAHAQADSDRGLHVFREDPELHRSVRRRK